MSNRGLGSRVNTPHPWPTGGRATAVAFGHGAGLAPCKPGLLHRGVEDLCGTYAEKRGAEAPKAEGWFATGPDESTHRDRMVLNDKIGQCFVNGARARDTLRPILFLLEYPGIRIEYEDHGELVGFDQFICLACGTMALSQRISTHLSNPRERPEHTPYTRSSSMRLAAGKAPPFPPRRRRPIAGGGT